MHRELCQWTSCVMALEPTFSFERKLNAFFFFPLEVLGSTALISIPSPATTSWDSEDSCDNTQAIRQSCILTDKQYNDTIQSPMQSFQIFKNTELPQKEINP